MRTSAGTRKYMQTCQRLKGDVSATEKDSAATECVDIDTNPNDECLSTSPTPPMDTGAIKATVTPPVKAGASEIVSHEYDSFNSSLASACETREHRSSYADSQLSAEVEAGEANLE